MEPSEHWMLGYAYGLLHGISLREDIPEEVKEKCKEAVDEYKKWESDHDRPRHL